MKAAVAMMVGLVLLCVGLAWARGGRALVEQGLVAGGKSALGLLPILLVVFLLTGLVEVLLPRDQIAGWLSDSSGLRGIGVAWLAGALTPGGGPVGLPLTAALARAGAGPGVLVTYLTSMALLSFIRVPMEMGIIGTRLVLLRVAATALMPPLAGLLVQWATRAR